MGFQVQVSGLQRTVRDLSRLGVEAEDLKDAFSSVGRRVQAESQSRVHSPSGRNRRAVRASRRKNATVITFNRRDRGRQIASFVFFDANNANKGRYGFIWQAVDAIGEDWIKGEVEAGLNRAIRRAGLG